MIRSWRRTGSGKCAAMVTMPGPRDLEASAGLASALLEGRGSLSPGFSVSACQSSRDTLHPDDRRRPAVSHMLTGYKILQAYQYIHYIWAGSGDRSPSPPSKQRERRECRRASRAARGPTGTGTVLERQNATGQRVPLGIRGRTQRDGVQVRKSARRQGVGDERCSGSPPAPLLATHGLPRVRH